MPLETYLSMLKVYLDGLLPKGFIASGKLGTLIDVALEGTHLVL
jgi:hypothetical protein